jgi:hypothetical protein
MSDATLFDPPKPAKGSRCKLARSRKRGRELSTRDELEVARYAFVNSFVMGRIAARKELQKIREGRRGGVLDVYG